MSARHPGGRPRTIVASRTKIVRLKVTPAEHAAMTVVAGPGREYPSLAEFAHAAVIEKLVKRKGEAN